MIQAPPPAHPHPGRLGLFCDHRTRTSPACPWRLLCTHLWDTRSTTSPIDALTAAQTDQPLCLSRLRRSHSRPFLTVYGRLSPSDPFSLARPNPPPSPGGFIAPRPDSCSALLRYIRPSLLDAAHLPSTVPVAASQAGLGTAGAPKDRRYAQECA